MSKQEQIYDLIRQTTMERFIRPRIEEQLGDKAKSSLAELRDKIERESHGERIFDALYQIIQDSHAQ